MVDGDGPLYERAQALSRRAAGRGCGSDGRGGAGGGVCGYVLDDQGALRRHVAVYIGGEAVRDRVKLSDPIGPEDDIYVFQALTGG